jgi:hypothetical protein
MSSRQNVNKEFMAPSQLTKDRRAAQPRCLWPFHATVTGALPGPRRMSISRLRYTIWKSADPLAWAPGTNKVIEEMTQPMPGQPVELVWNRIVSATAGAFFRIEITWLAP